jgi:protein-disulfide isomerase
MEKKNGVIIVLLVVLIGVVSGVGLLTGINNAVKVAISPLKRKLTDIQYKLDSLKNSNDSSYIQNELQQIQKKLDAISANVQLRQPQGPPPEDMNKVYTIDPGVSSILGNKNAPVTIVEFSDFQCPFCNRFYPVLKDVLGAYPGKVRVIIKNFPLQFHSNARPAAKLAMAANEQGKFQGMMEALLASGGDVTEPKIKEYAKNLGLNYNKLMADYKNKDAQWEKQVQDDMQLAAMVDVRGTPTSYINGRKTNARDLNSFKVQIDAILAGQK